MQSTNSPSDRIVRKIKRLHSTRRHKLAAIIDGKQDFHWLTYRSLIKLGLVEQSMRWINGVCIYHYSVPDEVVNAFQGLKRAKNK